MTEIALRDGQSPTYANSVSGFLPVGGGDIIVFTAPTKAGNVMKLLRLNVSAVATAAGVFDLFLYKRSTIDTGGVTTVITSAPYNSQVGPPTTVVLQYTTSPGASGAIIGTNAIRSEKLNFGAAGTGPAGRVNWQWGDRAGQAPQLLGPPVGSFTAIHQLCLSLPSFPAGTSLDIDWEFTEDTYA
jgi:hypothetical protein